MGLSEKALFNEIAKFGHHDGDDGKGKFCNFPPSDGYRQKVSEMHAAGMISDEFVEFTRCMVLEIATRSEGRYRLEPDFRIRPYQVFTYIQGKAGRKQLYIRFDATHPNRCYSSEWGASIGLGFDFRNKDGVIAECVNEYAEFYEMLYVKPALFDNTFGCLGGYAEPTMDLVRPVSAEVAFDYSPGILQHWLFFGRRLSVEEISHLGLLDGFVDECIRIFDMISDAGYAS